MTYLEMVKAGTIEAIRNEDFGSIDDFESIDDFREHMLDDFWTHDSITGNASGSYYCNSYKAMEDVKANLTEVMEALTEFCYESADIGDMFKHEEWEKLDVITRCYFLTPAIYQACDELF